MDVSSLRLKQPIRAPTFRFFIERCPLSPQFLSSPIHAARAGQEQMIDV
jgi:hypothetical protein